jgi:DDE family transposase
LVQQHVHAAGKLTAGPSAPPDQNTAFAATQAAWRFLHNPRLTLPALMQPLRHVARHWRSENPNAWALIVHDWSALSYPTHGCKKDRKRQGLAHSQGYDLGTLLLVDGRQGDPVAALEMELRTAQDIYSTRASPPQPDHSRWDNVLPAMQAVAAVELGNRVLHIIDREADSLAHFRQWHQDQHSVLVRGDANRLVRWQDEELAVTEVHRRLQAQGQFQRSRVVTYHGQEAVQQVAEAQVILDRPSWRQRRENGKVINTRVPGVPLAVRLIVSRVCNTRGQTLAVWYLWSNVSTEVDAATLALWYYWRWRIESFFKLLKSAGQAVEQWQQETGEAVAKRLLVAAMACVVVWKLERATGLEAIGFRDFLVRLSGRQMKYGKSHTAPALLAGLYVYLAMLEVLEHQSVEELRAMKQHLDLRNSDTG